MSAVVTIKVMNQILEQMLPIKEKLVAEDCNVTFYMWGDRGVGKTTLVRDFAKSHGYDIEILNFANIPIEEALGFPDGKGGYHLPKWFKSNNHSKPVIYFLDEINRAPKYVLQGLFNFINEGRIHQNTINARDIVIVAGNPDSNDYEVTCFEDKAFLSRFCHLYIEPTTEEFLAYCQNHDVHPALIKSYKQIMNNSDELHTKAENRVVCKPDNRNQYKIGKLLNILPKNVIQDIGYYIFSGMVGIDCATVILECWKDMSTIPSVEELFTMKKYPFKTDDLDKLVVINSLITKWFTELDYDSDQNKLKLSNVEKEGFIRYYEFIPMDYQVALIKSIIMTSSNDEQKELLSKKILELFTQCWPDDFITKLDILTTVQSEIKKEEKKSKK